VKEIRNAQKKSAALKKPPAPKEEAEESKGAAGVQMSKQSSTNSNNNPEEFKVEKYQVAEEAKDLNCRYPEVEYKLAGKPIEMEDDKKNYLNLVIIGHVDSGKSTLTGRLLYELGEVSKQ